MNIATPRPEQNPAPALQFPLQRNGPDLSAEDFAEIAKILLTASGIALTPAKKGLMASRLGKRLRELGIPDYASYIKRLTVDDHERMSMVSAMTTNVTGFFREPHHFVTLTESLLPALIERARRGGRVRLWSSACSTGEEPYSIAMTLLESCPDLEDLDVRVLATDIDPAALHVAERGVYPCKSCDGIAERRRKKFFQQCDEAQVVIHPSVRRLVTFNALNLIGDWPMTGLFDVIFCRNVVIYFNADTRTALWRRFAQKLAVGGILFIGHSERIDTATETQFETFSMTTYRRRS